MTAVARPTTTAASVRTSRTLAVSGAVLLAAAMIVAVIAVLSVRSPEPKAAKQVLRSQALGFSMSYGKGWNAVAPAALAKVDSQPAAMLRRADGRGLIVVRRTGSARMGNPRALATSMRSELARRFPDFRAVSARVVPIRSGSAFLFTFVRTRTRTVQTIALASLGTRTFQLEGIVPGDAPHVARETADILSSFGA